jgi:ATP-dependent DNA ligase
MNLPVAPPVEPMLARLTRRLPVAPGLTYEPKWDGFRCIAFRDGAEVDLRSRNQRPFGRYFPEVVDAMLALRTGRCVLDGEIVVMREGHFNFSALLGRLHPAASRVVRLRTETPAFFIAFDVIAVGVQDLRRKPFLDRRAQLVELLSDLPAGLMPTPATQDAHMARAWLDHPTAGMDGVVAKPAGLHYEPGRRAMVKIKKERTADCVVAGFRVFYGEPVVASLLLGLYDMGRLRHVGVASSFREVRRRQLYEELSSLAVPLEGHPWEHGFGVETRYANRLAGSAGRWTPDMDLDWVPLPPDLVCELAYDHWDANGFRHAPRFRRWRTDRTGASCTFHQFEDDRPMPLITVAPH